MCHNVNRALGHGRGHAPDSPLERPRDVHACEDRGINDHDHLPVSNMIAGQYT